jgi:hypothetical protein
VSRKRAYLLGLPGQVLGFAVQLRALFLRLGYGDEVAAQAPRLDHLVGDAVFVEVEMPVRLIEG